MRAHDRVRTPAAVMLPLVLVALTACAPPPDRSGAARDRAPATEMQTTPTPVAADAVDLVVTGPTPPPLDIEGTLAAFWWHHEVGTDLALSDEQVDTMDDAARRYLEGWNAALEARREGPSRVAAALAEGDLDGADQAADRYAEALAYVEGGHQRLKIEVFSVLDDSQRRLVLARYPQLLRDRWVVGQRLGRQPRSRPR